MTHDGKVPTLGCRCHPCHAARLRVWAGLSDAQRHALDALDRDVPRHPADLRRNAGVSRATIAGTLFAGTRRPPLVQMVYLSQGYAGAPRLTFYTLNQHGNEIRTAAWLTAASGRKAA